MIYLFVICLIIMLCCFIAGAITVFTIASDQKIDDGNQFDFLEKCSRRLG